MIHQVPDYKLQPPDTDECPQCGCDMIDGYCHFCELDQEFEAKCDEYDNREKLDI